MTVQQNYRPSNGTEGDYFMAQTCNRCVKDHAFHGDADGYGAESCPIILSGLTGMYAYPNELGPPEWSHDYATGESSCSAFEGPCDCENDTPGGAQ